MAYPYYQNNLNGWGTEQLQFGAPPPINFQPQPSWGGLDFFRAHAAVPDPTLYNQAFSRVRDVSGIAGLGVGMHEARHWHRRAYGGLGQLNQMTPSEIGHAAAYESYRIWIHNSSLYEPLGADVERQREGLIGLAVAETTRLFQYSGRAMDNYGRMTATESAAATASLIFGQSMDTEDFGAGAYGGMAGAGMAGAMSPGGFAGGMGAGGMGMGGMGMGTPGSMGGGMMGAGGMGAGGMGAGGMGGMGGYPGGMADPYAMDNQIGWPRRRHRHRHSSGPTVIQLRNDGLPPTVYNPGYGGASPVPIPGAGMGAGMGGASMGGVGMGAGLGGAGMGAGYGAQLGVPGMGMGGSPYGGSPYGGSMPGAMPGSMPGSMYGGASPIYAGGGVSPYGAGAYPQGTTNTIMLPRRHHHHHRHRSSSSTGHHHRRAKSVDSGSTARNIGGAVAGAVGGAAGAIGGAAGGLVGGLARGAVGGLTGGAVNGGMGGGMMGPRSGYGLGPAGGGFAGSSIGAYPGYGGAGYGGAGYGGAGYGGGGVYRY
ncbi:hypothetical protein SERLA73DRAFT_72584 [Serpula lacrymans var. lacrymans S7.3]|uniref:Uncharacterized protein n=1 Tax=Serpula lacrymans var. lacrymans (strain S7.3) TaxID=936435 RepID=F8PVA4_SERL3|nr:hypothetical protein SERLA73DRAFT_72584 [Serpula lacrymans var. lacrymans S7.3]